jgi:hypothetical protein
MACILSTKSKAEEDYFRSKAEKDYFRLRRAMSGSSSSSSASPSPLTCTTSPAPASPTTRATSSRDAKICELQAISVVLEGDAERKEAKVEAKPAGDFKLVANLPLGFKAAGDGEDDEELRMACILSTESKADEDYFRFKAEEDYFRLRRTMSGSSASSSASPSPLTCTTSPAPALPTRTTSSRDAKICELEAIIAELKGDAERKEAKVEAKPAGDFKLVANLPVSYTCVRPQAVEGRIPCGNHTTSNQVLAGWLYANHLPAGPFVREDVKVARLRLTRDNGPFKGLIICRYKNGTLLLQGRTAKAAMDSLRSFQSLYLSDASVRIIADSAPKIAFFDKVSLGGTEAPLPPPPPPPMAPPPPNSPPTPHTPSSSHYHSDSSSPAAARPPPPPPPPPPRAGPAKG